MDERHNGHGWVRWGQFTLSAAAGALVTAAIAWADVRHDADKAIENERVLNREVRPAIHSIERLLDRYDERWSHVQHELRRQGEGLDRISRRLGVDPPPK